MRDHIAQIIENLKAEGKVRVLNTPEDLACIARINKDMQVMRREFIFKSIRSEQEAAKIIFNT